MLLEVHRKKLGAHATLGEMNIDGFFECYTLEDLVRDLGPKGDGKIPHETAIPAGTYKVTLEWSNKFKKVMPYLHNVPFFTGILIHAGNTDQDTWGCVLVGDTLVGETIKRGTATPAFLRLYDKIRDAVDIGEEIIITLTNEF
jgi:hypothetical protein